MRIALVSAPRPGASFINRDLFAGMAVDDNFGTDAGASFVAYLKAEGTVIPEIAFPYLAALLAGHELRFFDGARVAAGPAARRFAEDVVAFAPRWIFASTSFADLRGETDFIEDLGGRTGARTVLFGYAANAFAREVLAKHAIDFVVSGEVEAVATRLVAGEAPFQVPGLWYRAPAGDVRHTGEALVDDLDALPFPDWSVTPIERYGYFPVLKARPFVTVLSSRGCTYCCDYCPYWVVQGARFRGRSAESVSSEMAWLERAHGVRSVLFRDPSFGLDRARVIALCRALVERGVGIDWGCETRLDGLDDEVIAWLGRAGCRSVEIGLDSVSPEAMRCNNRKTMSPDAVRGRLARLAEHGVASAGLFLIGLPGDTLETVRETIRFANTLPLTFVNYNIPWPFPGTPMYERAVAEGRFARVRFEDLRGHQPTLASEPELSTARLVALQSEGMRSFYVRPRRLAATLFDRDFVRSARFLLSRGWRYARQRCGRGRGAEERS